MKFLFQTAIVLCLLSSFGAARAQTPDLSQFDRNGLDTDAFGQKPGQKLSTARIQIFR